MSHLDHHGNNNVLYGQHRFYESQKGKYWFDYVVFLTLPQGTGEPWCNCYLTKDTDLVGSCKEKVEGNEAKLTFLELKCI